VVHFGEFEADLRSGELRRHGIRLKLADQSFRILALLLGRPGEVVTREELRQGLWSDDTFVDFEAGLNSAIRRLREVLNESAETPRYIETLPRRGYRFLAQVEPATPPRVESLAVLPLANLTGDPAQDYFVDGMTDALITRLAQISALRVISRTSVMQYKGARAALPEIGRQLQVDAVVEGAVTRSGPRVRITAQLVHAPTDRHLWAQDYERDLSDILLLQAEVASAIAAEVQVRLTPPERARLASARRVNPEAYEAYLRGRLHWNKRTEAGMRKGLELFQQALAKDPSYALSHAGEAECYNMMGYWGVAAPGEVFPNGRSAAARALEIDENLAEGHAARAWALLAYDWDWTGAERELTRALELNPGYAVAHQWYSHLLAYLGRADEAIREVQVTLDLDPLSAVMNSSGALIHLLARQNGECVERVHRTLEINSHFAPPYLWLGWALGMQQRHTEAREALEEAVRLAGNMPMYRAALAYGCAMAGETAACRERLAELEAMSRERYVSAYDFAVVYAGLGEEDVVLTWLKKASEERSAWLVMAKVDSRFDSYRANPRFQTLLRRLGLLS